MLVLSSFVSSGTSANATIEINVRACRPNLLKIVQPAYRNATGIEQYYILLVTNVGKSACTLEGRATVRTVIGPKNALVGPPAILRVVPGLNNVIGLKAHSGQAGVGIGFVIPQDMNSAEKSKCGVPKPVDGVILSWGKHYSYHFSFSGREVCTRSPSTYITGLEAEYTLTGF
jgi:hypothetical protein